MSTDDVMINVGRYTRLDELGVTGIALHYYLLRSAEEARPMLDAYARQLAFFNWRLDTLGFTQMTFVESGVGNSIALSGLYAIGRNQTAQRPVALDRNAAVMARLWFGGTVGVDARADDWLNANLATYLGMLYQARSGPRGRPRAPGGV